MRKLLGAALLLCLSQAARIADLVIGLPDIDRLNADWYSGYLDASATKKLHYVFVTSLTDPINDPVMVWFNGGPGCSSLLALFQEHGPYVIDDGEYFIKTNPFPWNERANILYLESPAGVGFSTAGLPSDFQHNDMSQSKDALAALLNWYKYFPEYLRNELYISGESYGGIYTPYLAWQVHQHNQLIKVKKAKTRLNLKGFIVGNGATQWDVDISPSFPDVMYNFNLMPKATLDAYKEHNCIFYFNGVKNPSPPENATVCNALWDEINNYDDGLNWYDLFRLTVPGGGLLKQSATEQERTRTVEVGGVNKTYKAGYTFSEYAPWLERYIPKEKLQANHPLLGDYLSDYANRPDVRQALNIPDHVQPWLECNNSINAAYAYQYEGSFWIYKIMKQYNYKMLFYSGDTDGAVPTYGTRRWIKMLNWPVAKPWTPWYTDGQVSGYFIGYEGLDFATIHGVGHMAPQWKRKDVTKLIMSWIHNEPLV